MTKTNVFTGETTGKIAELSNLALDKKEEKYLTGQFNKTLDTISNLETTKTEKVEAAFNVTGLSNVTREDKIDPLRILPQEKALSNAKRSYNGFFVVKGVLNAK